MRPILVVACSAIFAFLLGVSFDIPTAGAVDNIDGVWSALDANASDPSARREYAAVYDRVHRRYIMFAGFTNQQGGGYFLFNEVWMLDLDDTPSSWSHIAIAGDIPGGRHSPQWGYDPARNRLLVFGGYGSHYPGSSYAYLNDIWELKLNGNPTWAELVPSGTPPTGRLAGTAVFDILYQRFVGFGGTAGLPVDTWQLDLKGQPEWSTVATNGVEPPGRRSLTSIFDPRRDRMVIFGGWDGMSNDPSSFLNDTWALSLSSGDGAWTPLAPDGAVPAGRDVMASAYDPRGDRMVLFGGWSGTNMLGDTQFLTWNDEGVAATAEASAEAQAGTNLLQWTTENTVSLIGAVYRREPGTEWTSIGTVEADGAGLIAFDDNTVTPGHDYGYQIVVSSEVGDEFIGEVWLSSPTAVGGGTPSAAIALEAWPNPVVGPIAVSFALAGDDPARLEMFDVRGQRVLSRDVGAFGAGAHRLDIGRAKDYPSGVYFLRLTQSGRSVSSRFVLVR